ncbi:uncharacterized protein LOC126746654 [Anthonomus grandis grandis]|uniref:uncharacterized protein LOC126746654 n=1 Tax=Anthonomus grandis grandis TaxID=2921223 RepID=UPI00216655E5|nr:uncharacterized protein LOC126746654 [Anthonomus grandis grandis]
MNPSFFFLILLSLAFTGLLGGSVRRFWLKTVVDWENRTCWSSRTGIVKFGEKKEVMRKCAVVFCDAKNATLRGLGCRGVNRHPEIEPFKPFPSCCKSRNKNKPPSKPCLEPGRCSGFRLAGSVTVRI